MSVKAFPSCPCVGFNSECYVDEDGISPVVVPVATRTIISTTNYDVITGGVSSSPFMTLLIFQAPALASSYDAFSFSGGAIQVGLAITGNVNAGSTNTITCYGSPASGSGVSAINVPTTSSALSVGLVIMPNFTNPNISSVWTGTFTLDWTAGTITLTSTTSGSSTLPTGASLVVSTPTFRCPSSIAIGTLVSGTTYNIIKGSLDSSYFKSQTTPISAFCYGSNSRKWVGTFVITNGIGIFTTTSGSIEPNMYVISTTGYTFLTGDATDITFLKYKLVGVATTYNYPSTTGYAYARFVGNDVVYNTFVSNVLTPQAIISGSLTNKVLAGGTGGNITFQSGAVNTASLSAGSGNAGNTQSTTNYPVGLTNYVVNGATNSYATLYGGSAGVKTSADTPTRAVNFQPNVVADADTGGGQGGMTIYFYKTA